MEDGITYRAKTTSTIVFTLFNQEQFAFCVLHKWYIKRYTTVQIFDCFPVISLVQYNFFSATLGIRIFFGKKKHNPPLPSS
jgi:hypothetical protein